jgi:hypothetical protein
LIVVWGQKQPTQSWWWRQVQVQVQVQVQTPAQKPHQKQRKKQKQQMKKKRREPLQMPQTERGVDLPQSFAAKRRLRPSHILRSIDPCKVKERKIKQSVQPQIHALCIPEHGSHI